MLRAIAFAVGAASLGAEIASARLLAPYFGASTSTRYDAVFLDAYRQPYIPFYRSRTSPST